MGYKKQPRGHQIKPTAPITYLDEDGTTVDVTNWVDLYNSYFNIQELALLQTLTNRSLINCNCNLDKKVMQSLVNKINTSVWFLAKDKDYD
jgi:hypothetical protein